jgi:hypothetical protein
MVLGSVKDERTFSTITFIKSKLRNQPTTHLDFVVKMYAQEFFTLHNLLFYITMTKWNEEKSGYGLEYKLCM